MYNIKDNIIHRRIPDLQIFKPKKTLGFFSLSCALKTVQ